MIQSYSKKSICIILRYLWHSNLRNRKSSGKSSKIPKFHVHQKKQKRSPSQKKDSCSSCQSKLHIANPSIPNFPGNSDGPSTKSTSPQLVTSAKLQAMKNRCGNLKPSWNLMRKVEVFCVEDVSSMATFKQLKICQEAKPFAALAAIRCLGHCWDLANFIDFSTNGRPLPSYFAAHGQVPVNNSNAATELQKSWEHKAATYQPFPSISIDHI